METTFHSKVTTVDSLHQVSCFATNPKEIIEYHLPNDSSDSSDLEFILKKVMICLENFDIPNNYANPLTSKAFLPKTKKSKLNQICQDIIDHFYEMGLYGGLQGIVYHLIQLERIKRNSNDLVWIYFYQVFIILFFFFI